MEERRRSVRTELSGELVIKRLDRATGEKVTIHIRDVSKGGLGFKCDAQLEMGAIYECYLTLWNKDVIHAFVQIVRGKKLDDESKYGFLYGGMFIGMNELDAYRIEVYQTVEEYTRH